MNFSFLIENKHFNSLLQVISLMNISANISPYEELFASFITMLTLFHFDIFFELTVKCIC